MDLPVPLNERIECIKSLTSTVPPDETPLPHPSPTVPFWFTGANANPLARHGSEGPLSETADICIIGSGITGVSLAYHISNIFHGKTRTVPLKVLILEARDFCSGATGRNGGHLTAHAFSYSQEILQKRGKDAVRRALALEKYTVSRILQIVEDKGWRKDVDMTDHGRVELIFTEDELADMKKDWNAARDAGVDVDSVDWIDQQDVQMQYGASFPAVRMPGHNLWPLKLVTKLFYQATASTDSAQNLFSLGLHTLTPVNLVDKSKSTEYNWDLHTPRGVVHANCVVHATNGYASHLLPHLRGSNGIVPTRGQIIATRASTPSLSSTAFTGNEGFEYWFPRPSQPNETPLVILGGGREAAENFELYETDDSVLNPKVSEVLRRFLPAVFPGKFKVGAKPEYEWTGIMGYTKSGDPFVGPVPPDGDRHFPKQYISAGYNGHGMPRAFACAEVLAQLIYADMTDEHWEVPSWFPGWYLTRS